MNKNIAPVLIVVLILLQIITVFRIENLQNDLTNTRNQLNQIISEQSNKISNIYTDIDKMLKRQSSIIDSYDYSFGSVDIEKLTIPVTFNITPKETKENTSVLLYVSGESAEMNKEGTVFNASVNVPVLNVFEVKVVINDGDIQKTEKIDVWENLRERVFPTLYINYEGENTSGYIKEQKKLSGEYYKKGNLLIEIKEAVNNTIVNIHLVSEIGDTVVSEKPIAISRGSWIEIDERYLLSAGQTLKMTIVATDNLGFIHRSIIDKIQLDENADVLSDSNIYFPVDFVITDKDGKVLYEPQSDF
ncbi:MAG: hypothetical protein ACYCWE_11265 [Eubacteriales bacterium]